jgi:hypothetical protein
MKIVQAGLKPSGPDKAPFNCIESQEKGEIIRGCGERLDL